MSNPLESEFKPEADFFEQARSLRTLRTIIRALPTWCKVNKTTLSLNFTATPEGVEIHLGLPDGSDPKLSINALQALADNEKLMEMESTIAALRFFGGSPELIPDIINQMVEEAEEFARQIHPDGEVLPGFEKLHAKNIKD